MERYSVISEKQKREIVLLRGSGCVYKKCAFCDYYLDACADEESNFRLNAAVLEQVTGVYENLEVINSGSVFELDKKTLDLIKHICRQKGISVIHFESHYMYDSKIPALRREFSGFNLKLKLGLESFDYNFRENVLKKGIKERSDEVICKNFDEANLLVGVKGQTLESMQNDIELGLKYFERICVNVMCKNSSQIQPDGQVIAEFLNKIYPQIKDNPRADILIKNTDFGVGD